MLKVNQKEQYVNTKSGKIFVKTWSPNFAHSKVPLVLIHESLGSVGQWRKFPAELALTLNRPVIAYDRAGFGFSYPRHALPSSDFIQEEAQDYFVQLKLALGIREFLVLGHSAGGAMALNIAATDKECVGLISISAPAYVENKTLEGIRAAKKLFTEPQYFEKLKKWHGDKAKWVLDAWTEVWLREEFKEWHFDGLSNIHCKSLIIHGSEDEFGSVAIPQYIAKHIAAETMLYIIEHCGHLPHVTHKEAVLRQISTLFN
jgi:pimeloyl-ACP methyl ester carboxylesterase